METPCRPRRQGNCSRTLATPRCEQTSFIDVKAIKSKCYRLRSTAVTDSRAVMFPFIACITVPISDQRSHWGCREYSGTTRVVLLLFEYSKLSISGYQFPLPVQLANVHFCCSLNSVNCRFAGCSHFQCHCQMPASIWATTALASLIIGRFPLLSA